jgi:hypothetical protein
MFPRIRQMLTVAALAIVTGTLGAAALQQPPDHQLALQAFNDRVTAYGVLHRRLEGPAPGPNAPTDSHTLALSRRYLAAAIKAARPNARQGDIFAPAVADAFRAIIATALEGHGEDALMQQLLEPDARAFTFHPHVYDPFPVWASHEMPALLLPRLPPLPEDVEYRLIDHDLVLWDRHADLIVDVLPDAVARAARFDESD